MAVLLPGRRLEAIPEDATANNCEILGLHFRQSNVEVVPEIFETAAFVSVAYHHPVIHVDLSFCIS